MNEIAMIILNELPTVNIGINLFQFHFFSAFRLFFCVCVLQECRKKMKIRKNVKHDDDDDEQIQIRIRVKKNLS